MKINHLTITLLAGCILTAGLAVSQQANQQQKATTTTKTSPCRYSGSEEVANCILRDKRGRPFIARSVLRELSYDWYGLAQVGSEGDLRWMYVNRKGQVVISGVPTFDNWADDFSDGLVRTVVHGKYGFANRQGQIVIKPAYDWASPFEQGNAEVCNHCREVCAMPGGTMELDAGHGDCEHRLMTGGEWFKINKKGRIVARLPGN